MLQSVSADRDYHVWHLLMLDPVPARSCHPQPGDKVKPSLSWPPALATSLIKPSSPWCLLTQPHFRGKAKLSRGSITSPRSGRGGSVKRGTQGPSWFIIAPSWAYIILRGPLLNSLEGKRLRRESPSHQGQVNHQPPPQIPPTLQETKGTGKQRGDSSSRKGRQGGGQVALGWGCCLCTRALVSFSSRHSCVKSAALGCIHAAWHRLWVNKLQG